jgi:hypothetical protein
LGPSTCSEASEMLFLLLKQRCEWTPLIHQFGGQANCITYHFVKEVHLCHLFLDMNASFLSASKQWDCFYFYHWFTDEAWPGLLRTPTSPLPAMNKM